MTLSLRKEIRLETVNDDLIPPTCQTPDIPPSTIDWPLEIVAIVLDFLPQHRVYPFLSLSKGVNYIAKQRLLRQVYVLDRDRKPLLHDAVDELIHWLFLTRSQFLDLMETKSEWPGKLVFLEYFTEEEPIDDDHKAIKERIQPADFVVVESKEHSVFMPNEVKRMYMSTPLDSPHLAQATIAGRRELSPTLTKIRVDSLQLVDDVQGVDGCIDLSSVKQLSLVHIQSYDMPQQVASQFDRLEDLFVASIKTIPLDVQYFPQTVKRLVIQGLDARFQNSLIKVGYRFKLLLEYLELCDGTASQNWPRPITLNCHSNTPIPYDAFNFDKLKLYVCFGEVYHIEQHLGKQPAFECINNYG